MHHFPERILWNDPGQEKLWLYNLHYFEYLLPLTHNVNEVNFDTASAVLSDWIDNNPIGYGNGWEPYPISLRVVNWIFFYSAYQHHFENDADFQNKFVNSLYQQVVYLTHFMEFHILANHLFENVKSLLIAGLFFQEKKWVDRGWQLFENELNEQILPDGGHYERSPMYHSIILLGILDVVNIAVSIKQHHSGFSLSNEAIADLTNTTSKMMHWLQYMSHPDGDIALFSDSALNIAPKPQQIAEYYHAITGKTAINHPTKLPVFFEDSGYAIVKFPDYYFAIDGGELGVRYQPGHTHCDLFSYEYSYQSQRFIVDSGVGNYQESALRQKARSVFSHNSVVVNGMEQAEIWKVFRVGRWIKPEFVSMNKTESGWLWQGRYQNQLNPKKAYTHTRKLILNEHCVLIEDDINVKNIFKIESLIHLHPDSQIVMSSSELAISINNETIYILWQNEILNAELKDWFYVPEFGKIQTSQKLVLQPFVEKQRKLCYVITPQKHIDEARKLLINNASNAII